MSPRPCIQCGVEFEPRHAQTKICSDACKRARTAEKKAAKYQPAPAPAERECAECKTVFKPKRNGVFVCSEACRTARTRAFTQPPTPAPAQASLPASVSTYPRKPRGLAATHDPRSSISGRGVAHLGSS